MEEQIGQVSSCLLLILVSSVMQQAAEKSSLFCHSGRSEKVLFNSCSRKERFLGAQCATE
jgi:hypothetical protein